MKRLSTTEYDLMKICWRLGKTTGREIFDESLKQTTRDFNTVNTMLTRMAAKGYLEITMKDGKSKYYRPRVRERTVLRKEIQRFLDDVVGPEEDNRDLVREMLKS